MVTLFRFKATTREDCTESGTVLAEDERAAQKKLEALQFQKVQVKKVGGFRALIGRWVADIR